ncbi:MAG: trypsin-like serine protease, partial [Betaproteobacteria bacterium]
KPSWSHTKTIVRFLIVLGWLLAMPMTAGAEDPFDINALAIDDENRFSNVGAFIVAVVDDSGNPVGRRAHCSGVLIAQRVFLTAGHCTGPGKFGIPPNVKLFVSFGVNALDQSTWLAATRMTFPHPSLPPCPPPGCDPTTSNIFHAGDPGIQDTGLVFLEEPVHHIAPGRLAAPGFLETLKGARTPMTIVGYPLPSSDAEEGDWDGLRRFRTSRLTAVLDDTWATWSLPSNVCFGDSGGPIFLNLRPGGGAQTERLVANVSDGGIDCLSANTNARLDTEAVQTWIRQTIREVLGESVETGN